MFSDDEFWDVGDDDEDEHMHMHEDEDDEQDLQLDADEAALPENSGDAQARTANALLENIVELNSRVGGASQGGRSISVSALPVSMDQIRFLFNLSAAQSSARASARLNADEDDVDDGDEDDEEEYMPRSRRARRRPSVTGWSEPAKEPQESGVNMLNGGEYGRTGARRLAREKKLNYRSLLQERMKSARRPFKQDLTETMVPNSNGSVVAAYSDNVYAGQFSADSSVYYTCVQDFQLHVYDMKRLSHSHTPTVRQPDHQTTMKLRKSIQGQHGYWTVTDSHLSPDNERIIYSSLSPTVYMGKTLDDDQTQTPIYFGDRSRPRSIWDDGDYRIYSCRFSADGKEIIAGGSEYIFVYDLQANKRTVRIEAHENDVNSCCWADTASGNVLVSASDDTFLKVWDRRTLGAHPQPSGVLVGHTEGITYVSAKGDGRYVISNGKDQSLRLWDLRKMRTNEEYKSARRHHYGTGYDYRREQYGDASHLSHPKDCSVMVYRGHSVFRTLIRCHFSPAETTGNAYIYSGSADGKIHIWSLDGTVVQVLDRSKTLPMSYDPSEPDMPETGKTVRGPIVRDVSWHGKEPVILSAAWGHNGRSTVAWHEWKGLSKMNYRLQDWMAKQAAEGAETGGGPRRSTRLAQHIPGSFVDSDDEDEEEDDEDYVGEDDARLLDHTYTESDGESETLL